MDHNTFFLNHDFKVKCIDKNILKTMKQIDNPCKQGSYPTNKKTGINFSILINSLRNPEYLRIPCFCNYCAQHCNCLVCDGELLEYVCLHSCQMCNHSFNKYCNDEDFCHCETCVCIYGCPIDNSAKLVSTNLKYSSCE